jgi:hypothetical protein
MRARLRSLIGALCGLVATAALAAGAFAYFSAEGIGTAAASVGKLNTPAITVANPAAGGTVALTWSAVSAPGAGTVTYYVTRDGGEPAGNCPDAGSPAAQTTCTDNGLDVGSHEYEVTALFHTWTTTSAVKAAKVTIGPTAKFAIAGSTASPAAGGSVNLTITAQDANGATVTTFAGSHSLVFSGASASPANNNPTVANSSGTAVAFGSATALTFTLGVATVSSTKNGVLKVYRAGTASVSATEGAITTPTPLALAVAPAAGSKYTLAASSTTPTAGVPVDLTITALDAYGNLATGYTGLHNLVFSGASASAGGNAPTVTDADGDEIPFATATATEFNAGVATAGEAGNAEMTLYKSGAASIKATEGSITNATALATTTAAAPAASLTMAPATTTPVALASDNLTITAKDAYANTATSYAGAKSLTFSGAEASPSGTLPTVANSSAVATPFGSATALTFTNGVSSVSSTKNGVMKLGKVGAASVSATDGTLTTAPVAFTVSVGVAKRLALSGLAASAGTVSPTCFFACPVTGLGNAGTITSYVMLTDEAGNLVSNLGAVKTVTVTATGTAGSTITGSPIALPETGPAVSTTQFTYKAPASGAFTNTVTLASTGYTSATVTPSK